MTIELARKAFATCGVHGRVELLASGMSSVAWTSAVDDRRWVVRTPTTDGRRADPDYVAEATLNRALRDFGVPAPESEALLIDGIGCSIAPLIVGTPIQPDQWSDGFVDGVAAALAGTHSVPLDGLSLLSARRRFHLAPIWPLDDPSLADHPIVSALPDLAGWAASQRNAILHEASQPSCVVHSDLHWDHLIRSPDGRLAGLLDFGDAFAGPPAWDFACLRYYHGEDVGRRVAETYPNGQEVLGRSYTLGIAFGLYKLAKTPARVDVIERVSRLIREAQSPAQP